MSNEAQGLVRRLEMSAPNKPVLMAYANYANEQGYLWAGVDTIAWDTGYDERTVTRARRELVAGGWIATKRRFGKSAATRLNLAKMAKFGVDRIPRETILPELEFEDDPDVSAGQSQLGLTVLNVQDSQSYSFRTHSPEGSGLTVGLSISDSLKDPSLQTSQTRVIGAPKAKEEDFLAGAEEPKQETLEVVASLEFGAHRRPTKVQAVRMAQLAELAQREHDLTLREWRRHAQAAINDAKPPKQGGNAISYLMKEPRGALLPANLPVPLMKLAEVVPTSKAALDEESQDISADDKLSRDEAKAAIYAALSKSRKGAVSV